jgi:regulator of sigma E protease
MGPLMNLILAVVVTAGVLMNGAEIPAYQNKPPVVGQVTADSPAAKAGIQRGDRIVTVAGRNVDTWEQFFVGVGTRAGRETDIELIRDGKRMTVKATPAPQTKFEIGDIGVSADSHPLVGALLPGAPAEKAGLKVGDVILRVDNSAISSPTQLIAAVSQRAKTPVTISVVREGKPMDVTVVPEANTGRCPTLATGAGCIGISIGEEVTRIKPGLVDAFSMSIKRNYESASLIFMTIGQLITRETSTRQLMGPLAIAQLSGESAQQGWMSLFALMASISLNLGLLNLLPIPVLDGGHIFIMALEGLARRDFSLRVKEKMFLAGFAVLLMLMVTVIYNDLTRIPIIERLMPWRN